jgi:branched-chain amino acid aminotransferase
LLLNAKLIPYEDARVHVLSSAFKYGIAVYEGLRAYANSRTNELYGFRLREHFERLLRSMKVARMSTTFSAEDFQRQLIDLVRANKLHEDLHMRVQAYVDEDDGRIGSTEPVSVAMAAIPMGRYFAKEGVHVQVSSWTRISEANLPPRIKAAANYHNSRLALLQAKADGYDDAVLLGANGKVTEGPGYNLFMVRDGVLCTPPTTDGILEGITRDTLLRIASEDLSLPVAVRSIDRTELYVAEEVFFCGSAAEITPILSVERYLAIARGEVSDRPEWRTLIA